VIFVPERGRGPSPSTRTRPAPITDNPWGR